MKIFGYEINRAKVATQPNAGASGVSIPNDQQKTKPSIPLKSAKPRADLGDSGTRMTHGIIHDDYNPQMNGVEGIKIFDEMRKSDGTVRAVVSAVTLPVRRASFFVNPATQDEKDKEIASFVEHALFDWVDLTWDDIVRQALLMVTFGVMTFEKVYGTVEHDGKTYVTLVKLAPRLPRSILQWELPDKTFGIQQVRQDGQIANIPGSKLLIFVNEREGDNWWGTSMLRAAYKHWYHKETFYRIDAIAFERQGVGVPTLKMPQGYTTADENKAAQILQNIRSNEEGYMIIPPGYEFEFADMGSSTTRDPEKSINHHNKQILQSVLAQFLELGQASAQGSQALSKDHSDLFLKSLETLAKTICSEINKNLIEELVDMNFDGVTVYPKLDFSGIVKTDVTALATAYGTLVTAQAITPNFEDEQYLRTMLGLPARTQDDVDSEDDPSGEDQEDGMDIDVEIDDEDDKKKVDKSAKKTEVVVDPKAKKTIDDSLKKKEKNHEHKKIKRIYSNKVNGKTFKSWRPLTFAEKKVDFQGIQEQIDKLEENFTQQAKDLLNVSKDQFIRKLQTAIDTGDAKTIASLELDFFANYRLMLKKAMEQAYQYGKVGASDELKIPAPGISPMAVANIDMMADTVATKTMTDLETKAKALASQAIKNDASTVQQVGAIDKMLEDSIEDAVSHTAGLMVSQNVNDGRNGVFQANRGLIYALQRSEVLDKNTCNFCLSMDGLVVEPTDAWATEGIFHEGCRGIWVEILKDEQDVEEIEVTGVPEKIGDYYGGTPNALVQPPRAIVDKDSDAAKYIKDRDSK